MCMSHVYVHIYTNTYTTHQKKQPCLFKFLETEPLGEAQNGFEIASNPSASPTPARGLQVCAKMNS